jgi:hypothetical protein
MQITITATSGRDYQAKLHENGVIELPNGELSHIVYEKSMGKTITITSEKAEPAPVITAGRSEPVTKSKSKSKSSNKAG